MNKKFDDFIKNVVTEDFIQDTVSNLPAELKEFNLLDSATKNAQISILLNLSILRKYHEWLNEEN